MCYIWIMKWLVITHPKAEEEIQAFPVEMRARLARLLEIIEGVGPFFLKQPHVKNLGEKMMELRIQGKDGISRVIYVVLTGKKVALLHGFIKKTQKTPKKAIVCALKRMEDLR